MDKMLWNFLHALGQLVDTAQYDTIGGFSVIHQEWNGKDGWDQFVTNFPDVVDSIETDLMGYEWFEADEEYNRPLRPYLLPLYDGEYWDATAQKVNTPFKIVYKGELGRKPYNG